MKLIAKNAGVNGSVVVEKVGNFIFTILFAFQIHSNFINSRACEAWSWCYPCLCVWVATQFLGFMLSMSQSTSLKKQFSAVGFSDVLKNPVSYLMQWSSSSALHIAETWQFQWCDAGAFKWQSQLWIQCCYRSIWRFNGCWHHWPNQGLYHWCFIFILWLLITSRTVSKLNVDLTACSFSHWKTVC